MRYTIAGRNLEMVHALLNRGVDMNSPGWRHRFNVRSVGHLPVDLPGLSTAPVPRQPCDRHVLPPWIY